MTMMRRVLAVLLWLMYVVLGGAGGWLFWQVGVALYVLYLVALWFLSSAVLDVLHETLWEYRERIK